MPSHILQSHWIKAATALATLALHTSTWAHEGHGMEGSHWHATDIWGVLAAVAVAALVLSRRK
jgi:hypothetical protein